MYNTQETTPHGYLIVKVYTANGAIPLEGAFVSVSSKEASLRDGDAPPLPGDSLITVRTDRSGATKRLVLPAPSAQLSQSPGRSRPFAVYDITVELEGYERQFFFDAPVFDGITSIQPVLLKPLPENARESNFSPYESRSYENENPNL